MKRAIVFHLPTERTRVVPSHETNLLRIDQNTINHNSAPRRVHIEEAIVFLLHSRALARHVARLPTHEASLGNSHQKDSNQIKHQRCQSDHPREGTLCVGRVKPRNKLSRDYPRETMRALRLSVTHPSGGGNLAWWVRPCVSVRAGWPPSEKRS